MARVRIAARPVWGCIMKPQHKLRVDELLAQLGPDLPKDYLVRAVDLSERYRMAIKKKAASKPASRFRPPTAEDWRQLQSVIEKLKNLPKARDLAKQIHGGPAGLLLLEIGFGEDSK